MTLPQFLADLIRRIFAKTPKFFRYVQIAGLAIAFLTKLPDLLNQMNITVPVAEEPYKTILMVLGISSAVVSQLTVSEDSKLKGTINTK